MFLVLSSNFRLPASSGCGIVGVTLIEYRLQIQTIVGLLPDDVLRITECSDDLLFLDDLDVLDLLSDINKSRVP